MASKLLNYGCWCRFTDEIVFGHGTPADAKHGINAENAPQSISNHVIQEMSIMVFL